MDQYAFLVISAIFLSFLATVLILRKDLRKTGLALFLLVAPAAIISEYWYKKDYWQPPTVMPNILAGSVEDLLHAGSVMALSVLIYPFIAQKRLPQNNWIRAVPLFIATFTIMAALQLLSLRVGFPTVLTAILCCFGMGALFLFKRPDLMKAGVAGALAIGVITMVIYIPIFGWFFPDFWDSYWLMKDGSFGIYASPGVPITELLWYTSLGVFASVAYPFALQEKYIDVTTRK